MTQTDDTSCRSALSLLVSSPGSLVSSGREPRATLAPSTERLWYKALPMHVTTAETPAPQAFAVGRSAGGRWAVAVVVTLVMSVSYIDRQTLAALAPTVTKALAISLEQYGWVLSAFSLAYLVAAPLAGAVLDRAGARKGLVFAVLAWSLVAAGHALVPSFGVLVLLRILLGTAEAPSFPGAAQTMKRILPPAERSMGIGLLFTGSSLGAMVAGPLAIGLFHISGGWRTAFLGTSLLGLAWIPLWWAVTRAPDVRAALATKETAAPAAPFLGLSLLANSGVARAVTLVVFAAPSIMFGLNWSSHYLEGTFGLGQTALAGYIWMPPLGFDLGAIAFGALASRADRRKARGGPGATSTSHVGLMAGAALLASSMTLVPLLAHGPWGGMALTATSLAGGGGIFALLTGDMLTRVRASDAAAAGGLTASAQSLAYIVANPLVGRAVDTRHSYALVLVVLGAVVLPAMLAWAVWPVRPRQDEAPA